MRRLLLVEPDGRVTLCDLDSGERVGLNSAGSGEELVGPRTGTRTAAWSPAGQWAACALDAVELDGVHELRVHHLDSGKVEVVASELTAFYVCPSPCGRYVGHLSPGPLGLEFGLSDVETGELRIVERGQPLFWSWSPDASQLAVHVEDRVFVVPMGGGESRVLTEQAGSFLAPWWMPDGSVVVASDDRLINYGLDGSVTELAGACVSGRYALDPEGRRLAFVDLIEDLPALMVLDLLTGERNIVAKERTAGFFWSPEGRRLAALVVAGPNHVQWIVSAGDDVVRLTPFRPGPNWAREVLPFFEQYAQSHMVWSADGTQLVAPGLDADGSTEAVVQTVDAVSTTERVPGARLAWWAGATPP
jgi:TolB protein